VALKSLLGIRLGGFALKMLLRAPPVLSDSAGRL